MQLMLAHIIREENTATDANCTWVHNRLSCI